MEGQSLPSHLSLFVAESTSASCAAYASESSSASIMPSSATDWLIVATPESISRFSESTLVGSAVPLNPAFFFGDPGAVYGTTDVMARWINVGRAAVAARPR